MTADQIADLFREEKVTGLAGFTEDCPIANFLKGKGDVVWLYVGGTIIQWSEVTTGDDGQLQYQTRNERGCTGGILRFVCNFDAGHYPDLVRHQDVRTEHTIYDEVVELMKNKISADTLAALNNKPA